MTKKLFVFVLLLAAGSALALQQLDLNVSPRLSHLITGLLIGPQSVNPTDARINANRITRSIAASGTIDFASSVSVCTDSGALTVLGARVSDVCLVGIPAVTANSNYTCYVSATDAVKVRHCANGATIDPASGTFSVRVFSAQ